MANSVKVGGTIMWAFLEKKNEMSDKYMFDLCNLSKAACAAIEELGLEVKTSDRNPEKGSFITMKSNRPIFAFNPDGSRIEDNVGNGSKAQCVVGYYDWKFKNKEGRSPSPQKLVITDLVVFGGAEEESAEESEAL
jgi:hypothetical protein